MTHRLMNSFISQGSIEKKPLQRVEDKRDPIRSTFAHIAVSNTFIQCGRESHTRMPEVESDFRVHLRADATAAGPGSYEFERMVQSVKFGRVYQEIHERSGTTDPV
jgi:hypothetical protein